MCVCVCVCVSVCDVYIYIYIYDSSREGRRGSGLYARSQHACRFSAPSLL
jgi:hypothetical protein